VENRKNVNTTWANLQNKTKASEGRDSGVRPPRTMVLPPRGRGGLQRKTFVVVDLIHEAGGPEGMRPGRRHPTPGLHFTFISGCRIGPNPPPLTVSNPLFIGGLCRFPPWVAYRWGLPLVPSALLLMLLTT